MSTPLDASAVRLIMWRNLGPCIWGLPHGQLERIEEPQTVGDIIRWRCLRCGLEFLEPVFAPLDLHWTP